MRAPIATAAVAFVLASAIAGCSKGDDGGDNGPDCAFRSKCPNEIQRTQLEIDTCKQNEADKKCGSAYSAMERCTQANDECLPNGKVNHTKVEAVCKSEIAAYNRCAPQPTEDDAGSD